MPNISFASGGDTDTLDYVAYVAKDKRGVRSCFVLECKGGVAQEVITTIGQAFELRQVQKMSETFCNLKTEASLATQAKFRGIAGTMDLELFIWGVE